MLAPFDLPAAVALLDRAVRRLGIQPASVKRPYIVQECAILRIRYLELAQMERLGDAHAVLRDLVVSVFRFRFRHTHQEFTGWNQRQFHADGIRRLDGNAEIIGPLLLMLLRRGGIKKVQPPTAEPSPHRSGALEPIETQGKWGSTPESA